MSIFTQATRQKLRFATPKGLVSTEDLWDLPLTAEDNKPNLDTIARGLYLQIKSEAQLSFVTPTTASAEKDLVQLKFDVVKSIIDTKLAENAARAKAKASREKRQRLLAIIESKESEALGSKSIDELRQMLDEV
jgi:hypothetical protein